MTPMVSHADAPPPPSKIEHVRNLDYSGNGNPAQMLDLLRPADHGERKRPLVLFIHGGSWERGSKEDGLDHLQALADTGDYVIATINYRLLGEACWPAQLQDSRAALSYLRSHADEHGIDADRIGLIGVSAGGQLAAMLGTGGHENPASSRFPASSGIRCVVNFFGPSDLLGLVGQPGSLTPLEALFAARLFGRNIPDLDATARLASPLTWVSRESAPFFLIHGTHDPIVPFEQSRTLHRALLKAGVESTLVPVAGGGHGFDASEVMGRMRTFLENHLLG